MQRIYLELPHFHEQVRAMAAAAKGSLGTVAERAGIAPQRVRAFKRGDRAWLQTTELLRLYAALTFQAMPEGVPVRDYGGVRPKPKTGPQPAPELKRGGPSKVPRKPVTTEEFSIE